MSMIFYVARVSPEQIGALQTDPSLVLGATHIASCLEAGDSLDEILAFLEQQTGGDQPAEFTRHYEALRASATAAAKLNLRPSLCLEKQWHVLHFLLTGGARPKDPPSGALLGGDAIGADLGYGPARLLAPVDVAAFADFLEAQDVRQLLQRFDVRKMRAQKVYGASDDEDAEQAAVWVSIFVPKLRKFVAQARENGDGLLLWLS
jgi:hypothetical protein